MELIEYIGARGTEVPKGALVKKACGYLFFKDEPTKVFNDEIAQRLLKFPDNFTRREKGEADRVQEKAHDVSLVVLQSQVDNLTEQMSRVIELVGPLTELKALLEAQVSA